MLVVLVRVDYTLLSILEYSRTLLAINNTSVEHLSRSFRVLVLQVLC